MEYGFVYIWYDKKHKRYYIGAHWGPEDDGYICSSPWMKRAYNRRPFDFKRRILCVIYTTRKDMFEIESYWQSLIKDHELTVRYYNIRRHGDLHWSTDNEKRMSVGQKIANNKERNKKISEAKKGVPVPEERKQRISKTLKGRPINYTRTEETRNKIAENTKRLQAEGRVGMRGKTHSNSTKQLMSTNNAMNNPVYREKARLAKSGTVALWLNTQKKYAKPGSELYNKLIALGFGSKERV